MAAITLLFKKTNAKIGAVTLDASVSETHLSTAEATKHPVEQGSDITDHIRPKPQQLTIEGLISNTPLPAPSDPLQTRQQGSTTFQGRSDQDLQRAGQAYADLQKIMTDATTVSVVTALRTYENMALVSLSVPRSAKSGQALQFTAVLEEIRTVQSKKVAIDEPKAKPKEAKGKKPTEEKEELTSTLFDLFGTKK